MRTTHESRKGLRKCAERLEILYHNVRQGLQQTNRNLGVLQTRSREHLKILEAHQTAELSKGFENLGKEINQVVSAQHTRIQALERNVAQAAPPQQATPEPRRPSPRRATRSPGLPNPRPAPGPGPSSSSRLWPPPHRSRSRAITLKEKGRVTGRPENPFKKIWPTPSDCPPSVPLRPGKSKLSRLQSSSAVEPLPPRPQPPQQKSLPDQNIPRWHRCTNPTPVW